MVGFLISGFIEPSYLFLLFGTFLLFSAVMMLKKKGDAHSEIDHPWSEKLKLAENLQMKKVFLFIIK